MPKPEESMQASPSFDVSLCHASVMNHFVWSLLGNTANTSSYGMALSVHAVQHVYTGCLGQGRSVKPNLVVPLIQLRMTFFVT